MVLWINTGFPQNNNGSSTYWISSEYDVASAIIVNDGIPPEGGVIVSKSSTLVKVWPVRNF